MTIALEFERILQKVFIKKKHVISNLEKKGEYDSPIIILRFRGNLLIKINKNKILNPKINLKINKNSATHISLWNLYFQFHSPFFYYFEKFNYYLFSPFDSENFLQWEGLVHFNRDLVKNVFVGKDKEFVYVNKKYFRNYYNYVWNRFYFKETHKDFYLKKQNRYEDNKKRGLVN